MHEDGHRVVYYSDKVTAAIVAAVVSGIVSLYIYFGQIENENAVLMLQKSELAINEKLAEIKEIENQNAIKTSNLENNLLKLELQKEHSRNIWIEIRKRIDRMMPISTTDVSNELEKFESYIFELDKHIDVNFENRKLVNLIDQLYPYARNLEKCHSEARYYAFNITSRVLVGPKNICHQGNINERTKCLSRHLAGGEYDGVSHVGLSKSVINCAPKF